jgi:fumarate hydratase, class I
VGDRLGPVSSTFVPGDAEFRYSDLLPTGADATPYRLVTAEGVSTFEAEGPDGPQRFLRVSPDAIRQLTAEAMHDIAHYLRPAHLAQLRRIIDDPESSGNDRFVALDLLKNVNISAGGVLPMCQDTGTAIVMGKKSEGVLTGSDDAEAIAQGVYDAYTKLNLRYSQLAPLTTYDEQNTGTNLPAQIELYSTPTPPGGTPEYKFLFMAKGGGSANKSFLFQETKAILNPQRMLAFLDEKIRSLGTAACPPYHLAVVIGGTSAEFALKTAKYASAHYLDTLPTSGSLAAHGFRDLELEQQVFELTQSFGIGAQFGGKYFCHDVRVVRLPRHGASCPVAIAVSCSADRQALGKITADGVFLEQLETDPASYLPDTTTSDLISGGEVVRIDLHRPMPEILAELSKHPVRTRLSLTGPLVVARDIAHAKIKERLDAGEGMPAYLRDHAVYYAGPAKTPAGYASGSFGPTTAGRMDSYVEQFQAAGGSMVMLAKGNRSKVVTEACGRHGGFYLGSIGGPAARLAQDCITSVSVLEYEELGMEAVWKIEVEDFPAFVVVDDKGNDFFSDPSGALTVPITGLRVRSAE